MQIDIVRKTETTRSIISELHVDGNPAVQCYGLEPARTNPVIKGHPCIPAGHYRVVRTMSPRLQYQTPEVLNVPGRTAIRWHIGNYPSNVKGCIAVGQTEGPTPDFVGHSAAAFSDLMSVLNRAWDNGQEVWATYHDPEVEKPNAVSPAA